MAASSRLPLEYTPLDNSDFRIFWALQSAWADITCAEWHTREESCQVNNSVHAVLKDDARQIVLVLNITVHEWACS